MKTSFQRYLLLTLLILLALGALSSPAAPAPPTAALSLLELHLNVERREDHTSAPTAHGALVLVSIPLPLSAVPN